MKKPKREIVKWVDSRCLNGWVAVADIELESCRIVTTGYVVRETEEELWMATSYDKFANCYQGVILIPKVAITSRKAI